MTAKSKEEYLSKLDKFTVKDYGYKVVEFEAEDRTFYAMLNDVKVLKNQVIMDSSTGEISIDVNTFEYKRI